MGRRRLGHCISNDGINSRVSSVNPRSAIDALVGKSVSWNGRDLVLTNASMLALSALDLEESKIGDPLFDWALVWGAATPPTEILSAMRRASFGRSVIVAFAAQQSKDAWRDVKRAAAQLLKTINSSVCEFSGRDTKPSSVGGWVCAAASFQKEYGVNFDDFCAMPATRANAYHAAACERIGMQPVSTYRSREDAPRLEAFLETANFEQPARVRVCGQ